MGTDLSAARSAREAAFLDALAEERSRLAIAPGLPKRAAAFADDTIGLLFPQLAQPHDGQSADPTCVYHALIDELYALLAWPAFNAPADSALRFLDVLPAIRSTLLRDATAIHDGDPASHSVDEVILAYPGFRAIAAYRIAHELHGLGIPILPRLIAEHAHQATGIDIHPGAQISGSFAIDHGTGIVIGETAVLGERVRIYQGVTLGALSVSRKLRATKRHPTVGDDVVIYANATILGGDTVIGRGSVIGGNVWLTRSTPPFSVVTPQAVVDRGPAGNEPFDFSI
jgi:serine O-acetyltransferase